MFALNQSPMEFAVALLVAAGVVLATWLLPWPIVLAGMWYAIARSVK